MSFPIPSSSSTTLIAPSTTAATPSTDPLAWIERQLYGGAIVAAIPKRFEDCSQFRVIPDHQEVWSDADTDQSIIIELNSLDESVDDDDAAQHYQRELGLANDAISNDTVREGKISDAEMPSFGPNVFKSFCLTHQRISKFKESAEQSNIIGIYMCVVRLRSVGTDLLISINIPLSFGVGSSSAGRTLLDSEENMAVVNGVCRSLRIIDWGLFGGDSAMEDDNDDQSMSAVPTV